MICQDKFWNDWAYSVFDRPTSDLLTQKIDKEYCPELYALRDVEQCPIHHPEGRALVHTFLVCDAMNVILSREGILGERRATLMLAALLHDVGKAVSTEYSAGKDGVLRWRSPGHDLTGVPIAKGFLRRIGCRPEAEAKILPLIRFHMSHCRKDGFSAKSVRKLANGLAPASIYELLLLMEADCSGRGSASSGLPANVLNNLVPRAIELNVIHVV